MKTLKNLLLLFILSAASFTAAGQIGVIQRNPAYGFEFKRVVPTVGLTVPARFTPAAGAEQSLPWIAREGSLIYLWNTTTFIWEQFAAGVSSLGAVGSAPNANAGTITGTQLVLQPASISFPGVVTTGAQTFEGDKTFDNGVTAPSFWWKGATNQTLGILADVSVVGGLGAGNYGAIRLQNTNSANFGDIYTDRLTALRTYLLPDKSGTFAMLSDITSGGSGTVSNSSVAGLIAYYSAAGTTVGPAGIKYDAWNDGSNVWDRFTSNANPSRLAFASGYAMRFTAPQIEMAGALTLDNQAVNFLNGTHVNWTQGGIIKHEYGEIAINSGATTANTPNVTFGLDGKFKKNSPNSNADNKMYFYRGATEKAAFGLNSITDRLQVTSTEDQLYYVQGVKGWHLSAGSTASTAMDIIAEKKLELQGRFRPIATTLSTNATLGTYYWNDVTCNCTITVPTAVGIANEHYIIKNAGTGVVTVQTTSSQTIDGGAGIIELRPGQKIEIRSDNANWRVVDFYKNNTIMLGGVFSLSFTAAINDLYDLYQLNDPAANRTMTLPQPSPANFGKRIEVYTQAFSTFSWSWAVTGGSSVLNPDGSTATIIGGKWYVLTCGSASWYVSSIK